MNSTDSNSTNSTEEDPTVHIDLNEEEAPPSTDAEKDTTDAAETAEAGAEEDVPSAGEDEL